MDDILFIGIVCAVVTFVTANLLLSGRYYRAKGKRCTFSPSDPEVVVIGAGIGGSSLAAALSKQGRRVVVIERDMNPANTFRGEGLQPGGVQTLQDLGLGDVIEDSKGSIFDGLVIFDYETGLKTKINYSKAGITVYHINLLKSLRKQVKLQASVRLIEGIATELIKEDGRVVGVRYRDKNSQDHKVRAPLTVVCDGPYSKLRILSSKTKDYVDESYIVGLELANVRHPEPTCPMVGIGNPLVQTVTYRLDKDTSRILIAFRDKPRQEELRQFLLNKVVQTLPDFVQNPVIEAVRSSSYFKCIPSRRLPPSLDNLPGVLVLGDAFNCRDQINACGMTVTLKDVLFWLHALTDIPDLSDDEAFLQKKELFRTARRSYSWTINMTAHWLVTLAQERQSSSVKLRQALVRITKELEIAPKEIQNAAYDLFALINTDEALLRMVMYNTCREAVLECITWLGCLLQPWTTVREVYGIIWKYWSIIYTDV